MGPSDGLKWERKYQLGHIKVKNMDICVVSISPMKNGQHVEPIKGRLKYLIIKR